MIALLYLALLVAAFLILIVLPQRRQMASHRALVSSLATGDEVVTSGGIYGTIRSIEDAVVDLEVAEGIVMRVARGAIAQRVGPVVDDKTVDADDSGAGDDGD